MILVNPYIYICTYTKLYIYIHRKTVTIGMPWHTHNAIRCKDRSSGNLRDRSVRRAANHATTTRACDVGLALIKKKYKFNVEQPNPEEGM